MGSGACYVITHRLYCPCGVFTASVPAGMTGNSGNELVIERLPGDLGAILAPAIDKWSVRIECFVDL